jgi:aerobic-type carbon monoxide dehydrogenase small subunit (CoxS/CutS family)
MPKSNIRLTVNGAARELEVEPGATLLEALRGPLGLIGAKGACGRGECGSCTVLVDGVAVLACLSLAVRTRGAVTTVEGLEFEYADLRAAFADMGGFQCGFCTSGQIVRGAALLRSGLPADRHDAERVVRYEMSGNICRCTGYNGIVDAILLVADRRRHSEFAKARGTP